MADSTPTEITNRCDLCGDPICKRCPACTFYFCELHASETDDTFCQDCVTEDSSFVKVEPLVNRNGGTEQGSHIVPVGEHWFSSMRTVSVLTDTELGEWIDRYRHKVKEEERKLQYNRIMLSSMELENHERGRNKIKVASRIIVSGKPLISRRAEDLSPLAKKFKGLGITKEMVASIIKARGGK